LLRAADGSYKLLTKGDNNEVHDRGLYNRGQKWLNNGDIIGRVKANTPYVGLVTIIMNDYPQVKKLVLGIIAIFVLQSRE
jgi:signal peptidase